MTARPAPFTPGLRHVARDMGSEAAAVMSFGGKPQSSAEFALQALENVGADSLGFDDVEALLMKLDVLTFEMSKRPGMRGMQHVEKRIADALHELTLAEAAYNCPSCNGDGCGACFGSGVTR